ncbi:MAG: helix-hairpin-helix domain-containing protein [Bacteroidota bacterium]|nr:helix-hairpin-helix domain-containing protein [Bacteroidota bacterium]
MKSQKWKDLMAFSAREKRGLSVLIVVVLLLIVLRVWAPWKNSDLQVYDFSGYEADIDKFEMQLTKETKKSGTFSEYKFTPDNNLNYDKPLFPFNPNTVTVDEMLSLGFTDKLAQNIVNYRNAGGKFYEAADMKKIYAMPEKFYLHIKSYIRLKNDENKTPEQHKVFQFNPNKISSDSLQLLGFAPDVSERWIKYRKAVGGFENLDDIKKLYGIDTALLHKLSPIMSFNVDADGEDPVSKEIITVQINTTNKKGLIETEAVSESIAQRIITYRNLLGGYYKTDQLLEVYGMSQTNLNKLKDHIIIDEENITHIDLNKISFGDLLRHPYMTKNNVKNIMKYRDFAGRIKHPEELLKNNIIADTTYQKIIPYIHLPKKTKNKIQNPK